MHHLLTLSSSYCSDDTDPTPSISGTTGGTFGASSGVVINSSNGTIDLDASTTGTHTITYTTPGGSCSASSTWSITILIHQPILIMEHY